MPKMETDVVIKKAMEAMGWDVDSDIPMANKENLGLIKEIEALYEERGHLIEAQRQSEDRRNKLMVHSKSAKVTINHNLQLLSAYQTEMSSESHLYKIAEREHSKLREDLQNMDKELENHRNYIESMDGEIAKRQLIIQQLMCRMNWAQTALLDWREIMEDGNKSTQLIEQYFKEDQIRARQKDQRRLMLQNEIDKLRQKVIHLYDQNKTLEQHLNSLGNMYRTAHAERRQLIDTWKTAVNQMIQRETNIQQGEKQLATLTQTAKNKAKEQKDLDDKVDEWIENNRAVEDNIEELNNEVSELREQLQIMTDTIILKENEVELVQKELQALSNRVQTQRSENRQNQKQKIDKLSFIQTTDENLNKLQKRLESMQNKSMTAAQRLHVLEELADAEEKAIGHIHKETDRTNGLLFRSQQQLNDLKSDQKTLEAGISSAKVTIGVIRDNRGKIEKALQKKTEMHYDLSFKCLQVERRLIKMQGGNIDPETEQKNRDYLAQLEASYADVQKRLQTTEAQNKKLDDNMRNLTMAYNNDGRLLEDMLFKVKDAQMYCQGGIKKLKGEEYQNQERIVELNILKMKAHEFELELANCAEGVYNLEKHRANLNRTIKDRMVEIRSQMDLLNMKRKHLNEEKATLRADIGDRMKHIDAVKSRFELTSKLLGRNHDGTIVTATQLRVENAQEKQMLLDEGEDLNKKVLKAEDEVKALENTLIIMNHMNNHFRKTLNATQSKDEAEMEYGELNLAYCRAVSRVKTLRFRIVQLEGEIDRILQQKAVSESQLQAETNTRIEKEEELAKLKKELAEQQTKLDRAERDIKLALKACRMSGIKTETLSMCEQDMELREIEHRNMKALNHLADMTENNSPLGPHIIRLIDEKGLKLPHLLQKGRSLSSWRSDVSLLSVRSTVKSSRSYISEGSSSSGLTPSIAKVTVFNFNYPNNNAPK